MDNELLLIDRIDKIRAINEKYDLENNAYISFSGGKDSTILHYLIDLALPNNKIPRLFINTGIEYNDIVKFVKELQSKDDRFFIISSNKNIKQMLENEGYPFKSKEHSNRLNQFQKGNLSDYVKYYIGLEAKKKKGRKCPKKLLYQFQNDFSLKVSDKCCYNLKKSVANKFQKQNNKSIVLTGMRKDEGGERNNLNCIVTKKDKLVKFHPLSVVSDDFQDWFINEYNIKLCNLYYPPFNFQRTGCKGCPFSLDLQNQLNKMEKFLPNEKKQCETIWQPVYKEYRRINYRLKKQQQISIFDFEEIE